MANKAQSNDSGPRHGRSGITFWGLLLPVPALLAGVMLVPQLGAYGEGLLPELLGTHVLDTEDLLAFAFGARVWGGAILGLSCLVGVVFWYVQSRGWRARLAELRAERVMGYRAFVLQRLLLTILVAVLLAAGMVALSSALRGMPIPSWFYLLGISAAIAAVQFYFVLLGIRSSRRLYLGR